MAPVYIERIQDTWANAISSLNEKKTQLLTDQNNEHIHKIGSNFYFPSMSKYWNGSIFTYMDGENNDFDVYGDLTVAEYIYHNGESTNHIRFETDTQRNVVDSVEFMYLHADTQDIIEFNRGEADVDFVVNANSISNAFFVQGSDGYVGMGTATPSAPLEINGTADNLLDLNHSSETGDPYISFSQASTRRAFLQYRDTSGSELRLVNESGRIGFFTDTLERFRVESDGGIFAYAIPAGTDNSVLVLNSSNEIVTDEIDPKVWAGSLVDGSGTANYVSKWTGTNTQGDSLIYDDGTRVGVGYEATDGSFEVLGDIYVREPLNPLTQFGIINFDNSGFMHMYTTGSGRGIKLETQGSSADINFVATDDIAFQIGNAADAIFGITNSALDRLYYINSAVNVVTHSWYTNSQTLNMRLEDDGGLFLYNLGTGTDNSVLVLNSSNEIVTDEIDPRVWGASLIDGSGTANYVSKFSDSDTLTDSIIYESSSKVGIGTTSMAAKFEVWDTGPQMRLRYDTSNYSQFGTDSSGNLEVYTTGGVFKLSLTTLQLGDTYASGSVTANGTIEVKDSSGTSYYLLASTTAAT